MLRIPMWVYESLVGIKQDLQRFRYESPCGFMRSISWTVTLTVTVLRIPMWVYERNIHYSCPVRINVTNPHVGL